jgi:hypothetical protein
LPSAWLPLNTNARIGDFHNNIDLMLTFGAAQSASGHRG